MLVSSTPSGTFFARMFSSNTEKQLASAALQAGKTAEKYIGMKAIYVGKTIAIDAGEKLVKKAPKTLSTPKSQVANVIVPPEEITKKVNEVIAKYVDTSAINLIKLIDGSSVNRSTASNAVPRETIKWIGFKSDINFCSSSIKNDGRYIKMYRYPNYLRKHRRV